MKNVNGPTSMYVQWNDVNEERCRVIAVMGDCCGFLQRED